MKSLIYLAFLFVSYGFAKTTAIEEKYFSYEELDLLLAKKNWTQLLAQLPQISPSERNVKWEKLVEKGAIGYLTELSNKGDDQVYEESNALLSKYGFLSRTPDFLEARRDAIAMGIKVCYRKNKKIDKSAMGSCSNAANLVAGRENTDPKLIDALGKTVREEDSDAASLNLYDSSLHVGNREEICELPNLKRLLASSPTKDAKAAASTKSLTRRCAGK